MIQYDRNQVLEYMDAYIRLLEQAKDFMDVDSNQRGLTEARNLEPFFRNFRSKVPEEIRERLPFHSPCNGVTDPFSLNGIEKRCQKILSEH